MTDKWNKLPISELAYVTDCLRKICTGGIIQRYDGHLGRILYLLEDFLKQKALVSELPGKLAIVEPGRVRIRRGTDV